MGLEWKRMGVMNGESGGDGAGRSGEWTRCMHTFDCYTTRNASIVDTGM